MKSGDMVRLRSGRITPVCFRHSTRMISDSEVYLLLDTHTSTEPHLGPGKCVAEVLTPEGQRETIHVMWLDVVE